MRKLRAVWLRLRETFRNQTADQEFAAELESSPSDAHRG